MILGTGKAEQSCRKQYHRARASLDAWAEEINPQVEMNGRLLGCLCIALVLALTNLNLPSEMFRNQVRMTVE